MIDDSNPYLDDAKIVSGLRDGDANAWDALCERYGKRVWAFLVRLVGGDDSVVGDLFQDTFLAAAKSGVNLDAANTRLWSWLAQIAHNRAAEHWRRIYRDRRITDSISSRAKTVEGSEFGDPVKRMFQDETVSAVRNVLAKMAGDHVTVLISKYVDDQSVAAIVEEIGGTTESVRSRLARARREFKSLFEQMHSIETAD